MGWWNGLENKKVSGISVLSSNCVTKESIKLAILIYEVNGG